MLGESEQRDFHLTVQHVMSIKQKLLNSSALADGASVTEWVACSSSGLVYQELVGIVFGKQLFLLSSFPFCNIKVALCTSCRSFTQLRRERTAYLSKCSLYFWQQHPLSS